MSVFGYFGGLDRSLVRSAKKASRACSSVTCFALRLDFGFGFLLRRFFELGGGGIAFVGFAVANFSRAVLLLVMGPSILGTRLAFALSALPSLTALTNFLQCCLFFDCCMRSCH